MTNSRWRAHADMVIDIAMQDVPLGSSEQYIRNVLKPLYPFGQRQYLPYKHWCAAVRETLASRGVLESKRKLTPWLRLVKPRRYTYTKIINKDYQPDYTPAIQVVCPCCPDRDYLCSCMVCGDEWQRAKSIMSDTFSGWLLDAFETGDPLLFGQIGDWLLERGHDDLVEQLAKIQRNTPCRELQPA